MPLLSFFRRTYLYILAIPLLTIVLGIGLNEAVLIANHGSFPVMVNAGITPSKGVWEGDPFHMVMTPTTHMNPLADVFLFQGNVYSIGDGFIYVGYWLWSYAPLLWGFLAVRKLSLVE